MPTVFGGNVVKVTLVECSFGLLAFDEENKLAGKFLFPKDPHQAAEMMLELESGKLSDRITEFLRSLKEAGYTFVFENAGLAKEAEEKLGVMVEVSRSTEAGDKLRSNMEGLAVQTGFVENAEEFARWMHGLTMEVAKLKVRGAVEKRDLTVAQAIQALDDLDKSANLLMTHVREWYGIHFPELDRILDKHETYARLVVNLGHRDNFTVENLRKEDVPEEKATQIASIAEKSMGADIAGADLAQIQSLAANVMNMHRLRQDLEYYMDKAMEDVAPNIQFLVGSLLGARLIAVAGGLSNLARKPASTIQVLGAEKALFRSLKTGSRPPKHGLLFQHTLLHDAKKWQRGKIARAIAGKLAIAARADAFGKRLIGEQLKADLDRRIAEIREKYKEPPPIPQRPQRTERPMSRREEKRRRHGRAGRR